MMYHVRPIGSGLVINSYTDNIKDMDFPVFRSSEDRWSPFTLVNHGFLKYQPLIFSTFIEEIGVEFQTPKKGGPTTSLNG